MSPWRSTKLANTLLVLSAVAAVFMLLLAVIYGPDLLSGASTTQAVKDGNDIASCRSAFRVAIDTASAALDDARGKVELLTNEGLEAVASGDDAALARLLPQLAPARAVVAAAERDRSAAVQAYADAIDMSRADPDAFLHQCQEAGS